MSTSVPERASIVIVGGGVMGASIAFHLAEAGVPDVLLVERNELGSGSTVKAAGGVRAQFSDPMNIALGARSLEAFEKFQQRPGRAIDLHQVGYLFLHTTAESGRGRGGRIVAELTWRRNSHAHFRRGARLEPRDSDRRCRGCHLPSARRILRPGFSGAGLRSWCPTLGCHRSQWRSRHRHRTS